MTTPKKCKSLNASIFARYFKSINSPESDFFQPDEDILFFNERYLNGEIQIMFEELNVTITDMEIKKACKDLNSNRSGGPDLLINEFFKNGIDSLIRYFNQLFNKILESGHFPEQWSEGRSNS